MSLTMVPCLLFDEVHTLTFKKPQYTGAVLSIKVSTTNTVVADAFGKLIRIEELEFHEIMFKKSVL